MPKRASLAFVSLVLPLLFAPVAPIMAQETGSSTEPVNDAPVLPSSPLDGYIKEWLGGLNLKDAAQQGMNQAQTGLEQAAGQALDKAQDAARAELERQADQAIQTTKEKAQGYVGGVVAIIKSSVTDLISKIKLFFADLFKKNAPTY